MLKVGLCRLSTNTCMLDVPIDGLGSGALRLGACAYDQSYTQLWFTHDGANVTVETSQLGPEPYADLVVRLSAASVFNYSDYVLVVAGLMADEGVPDASWHLPGNVTATAGGVGALTAVAAGSGAGSVRVRGVQPAVQGPLAAAAAGGLPYYLSWPLQSITPQHSNDTAAAAAGAPGYRGCWRSPGLRSALGSSPCGAARWCRAACVGPGRLGRCGPRRAPAD